MSISTVYLDLDLDLDLAISSHNVWWRLVSLEAAKG